MFGALGVTAVIAVIAVSACSQTTPPADEPSDDQTTTSKPTKDGGSGNNGGQIPTTPGKDASADSGVCKTTPPTNRCGLVPQCGCGTNETCDVTNPQTGATSCLTAGNMTLGRPCSQSGQCVQGLACVFGACRPYCESPTSKCTAPGTDFCMSIADKGSPNPDLAVCSITCDPRMPQAVCGQNTCIWFPKEYIPAKFTDCNAPGPGVQYDLCNSVYDCGPGLACVMHPTQGQECERWCRLGQVGDCGIGLTCKDAFGSDAPTIDGIKLGVCQD
ncbi:hypothetical protein AKJ09_04658 [Labilithrix luteola]|uniref:Tryptophan synthase alpha chain n=1 Tax=Labilithrix luteola TaxID=1391654 RepID=A0A0K1PXW7_9BACT|nr:hypothetical protein AKJ09_04658 [Labilithrix luteola]